jgi:hypothetical protein
MRTFNVLSFNITSLLYHYFVKNLPLFTNISVYFQINFDVICNTIKYIKAFLFFNAFFSFLKIKENTVLKRF